MPVETIFTATPAAMITGDGRALSAGAVPAIYPGPLLPNVLQRSITPEATQDADRRWPTSSACSPTSTYARNDQIADAADTVVTHHRRRHDLPPPGVRPRHGATESDPDRANLAEFVVAVTDLPTTVGADQLGAGGAVRRRGVPHPGARRRTPSDGGDRDRADVVDWPADASVRLADAGTASPCRSPSSSRCSPTPRS